MVKLNRFSGSFIGVVFPSCFLGFMVGELDHNSTYYVYEVFCSLSIDSLCSIRSSSHVRVSNLPYNSDLKSELDYFKILDQSSKSQTYPFSVFGRLGIISFGFDKFSFYGAANLRKITGAASKNKVASLSSFPLYQLESLKDLPDCSNYPITYKRNAFDGRYTIVEGMCYSHDFPRTDDFWSWTMQVFIEIGFRNPKDIMIHPTLHQFQYWSDIFLKRLGINTYRLM